MTVFEMLSEVVRAEELLGLVAFAKFVIPANVVASLRPVSRISKLCATKAADVCQSVVVGRRVEYALNAVKSCT